MSLFIKNIFLVQLCLILAILYPTSLANLVVEVGTRHSHQTLLVSTRIFQNLLHAGSDVITPIKTMPPENQKLPPSAKQLSPTMTWSTYKNRVLTQIIIYNFLFTDIWIYNCDNTCVAGCTFVGEWNDKFVYKVINIRIAFYVYNQSAEYCMWQYIVMMWLKQEEEGVCKR